MAKHRRTCLRLSSYNLMPLFRVQADLACGFGDWVLRFRALRLKASFKGLDLKVL